MGPFNPNRTERKYNCKACLSQQKIIKRGLKFSTWRRPFLDQKSTLIKCNSNVSTSILTILSESLDKYILNRLVCFG